MENNFEPKKENGLKEFFNHKIPHTAVVGILLFLIIPAIAFGFWYGYKSVDEINHQLSLLSNSIVRIDARLSSTTVALEKNIQQTKTTLSEEISKEKQNTENKFSNVESEFGNISGTVDSLEKLSKMDEELLKKYSKVFFLNEHYAPSDLLEIPNRYKYYEDTSRQFHEDAWPFLRNMLKTAKNEGVDLYAYSAYRSFDTQEDVKNYYEITYGNDSANRFSADQGYSEHQLGTTVDLITTGIDGTLEGFSQTNAFKWLKNNAHKYGFTMSYPENNEYYVYEPWQWRIVGVKLATDLKESGKHFYDLSQPKLDEYLISIFD